MSYKKGKNGEDISDEEIGAQLSQSNQNGDEEVKTAKTTGKRGRPRKHPAAPFETHIQKSKRGRKPKPNKLYDIDPNDSSKIKIDMNFNESDENDTAKMYDEIEDNMPMNNHLKQESQVGPIEGILNNYMDDNKFIPSNPPQFQSPTTFLGPRSPAPDFKSKGNFVFLESSNQTHSLISEDNPIQKKLNEIIAQSFNNWNNEPKKRKDTDVDFAKNVYPMNAALSKNMKSIMSPDYKSRAFSINSNGWNFHKPSFDYKGRFSIDDFSEAKFDQFNKMNQDEAVRKLSTIQQHGEIKNELLNRLKKNSIKFSPIGRKATMINNPVNTLKQSSPLSFPNFSNAFKPFKKRAQSFHINPV